MKKVSLTLLFCLFFLVPNPATAQSPLPNMWLDERFQDTSSATYFEHWTYDKWAKAQVFNASNWGTAQSMRIYASPSNSQYNATYAAMYEWLNSSHWPARLVPVFYPNQSDVTVWSGACSTPAYACIDVQNWYNSNPYQSRLVQYWFVKTTGYFAGAPFVDKQHTMAHELGHVFGRDEYFYPGGGCNSSGASVMDAHGCDPLPVQSLDHTQNKSYWDQGSYQFYAASNASGYHFQAWKDFSWNDGKTLLEWYYWNGSNWANILTVEQITPGSGSHRAVSDAYSSIDHYVSFAIGPGSYGVPPYSSMKLCTTPIMAGIHGTRSCGTGVTWVP